MTRTLLLSLALASLTACASSHVKGTAPDTDLQLLELGVKALTTPRQIADPVQHPYQARNGDELWELSLALDDMAYLSEGDTARTFEFVHKAVEAIRTSRRPPCPWWNWKCQRERRSQPAKEADRR